MLYYNPYSEELKDERLELVSEKLRGNTKYLLYNLYAKQINTCSKCNSNNTIKYGIRRRKIEMSLLAHFKIDITLEYSRFKCKDCLFIFSDDAPLSKGDTAIIKRQKLIFTFKNLFTI